MPVDLDAPTKAIMTTLADTGYIVVIGRDPDGRIVASARDTSGETWQVWVADAYAAVGALAQQVGFQLDDG
ncbi:MAG: hypothetical protein IID40_09065 [Planctomycetes bacterium]|nr:hypothetical protein [Planctomycetota bacterium]